MNIGCIAIRMLGDAGALRKDECEVVYQSDDLVLRKPGGKGKSVCHYVM